MSELKGLEEALKKLQSLPDKVHAKIGREGIAESAELIRAAAVRNLEAIGAVDTGELARSVSATKPKVSRKHGEVKSIIQAEFYGRFIEHGFYHVKSKKHIPARPWMVPALEENEAEVLKIVSEKVAEVVSRIK